MKRVGQTSVVIDETARREFHQHSQPGTGASESSYQIRGMSE